MGPNRRSSALIKLLTLIQEQQFFKELEMGQDFSLFPQTRRVGNPFFHAIALWRFFPYIGVILYWRWRRWWKVNKNIVAAYSRRNTRRNASVRACIPDCRHAGPLSKVIEHHRFDIPSVYTTDGRLHTSYYSKCSTSSSPYRPRLLHVRE